MAWTYTTDLTADKDKIRLLVGDTLSDLPLLSDEEIDASLALQNSNLYGTAESLCRSLSARFGREANLEAGPVKDQKGEQARHFLELAERYAGKVGIDTAPYFTGGVDSTGSQTDPFFTRELQLPVQDIQR